MSSGVIGRRLAVVGCTGAGKSTLARAVAERAGVPHVELDGLYHQPGWTPLDPDVFRARVRAELARPAWVVDGNYTASLGELVLDAADTIAWVDPPRRRVMRQVIGRTLRRGLLRESLWNGNRESLSQLWKTSPEDNLVLWAWTRFPHYRARYGELAARDPRVVRLATRREVAAFVDAWAAGSRQPS
jgi:adenylate kinase family enzyme